MLYIDGLPFSQSHYAIQILAVYPPLLKWADVVLERNFLNMQSFQELLSSAYSQPADEESANGYMTPFKTQYSGSAIFRMSANSGYASINDSILNQLPKLIIWGKNDQWIPIGNASNYLIKPNTQSFIVEDAGHCPMETHPQKVNAAITDFISKLD